MVLLQPGDERRRWIRYETQVMLQVFWKNSQSRIAALIELAELLEHIDALRLSEDG